MVQSEPSGTLSSKENLVTDNSSKSEAINVNFHEADTNNKTTSTEACNDQVVPKRRYRKRVRDEATDVDALPSRRMPRRAAACLDFKEKEVCMPDESDSVVNVKREPVVDEEIAAINLTVCRDMSHPESDASTNRHLSNFTFHDVGGKLQSVEMLQVTDLFITGVIHPSKANADKHKENGVRCRCFGRIESWRISGYEDGLPVIWVSTKIADYECIKPATSYRKIFSQFFEKAHACVQVYRTLSKYSGGTVDIGLHELLAAVVRSMKGSKNFSSGVSIKEFLISQGDFIYNQLIGLDTMSKDSDQKFSGLPVLVALQKESKKNTACLPEKGSLSIKIGDAKQENSLNLLKAVDEEDEDAKLARLLQEEEDWRSMNQRKGRRERSSSKYYIIINEDEIAADYPLPAYYKPTSEETDEYTIFDDMYMYDADQLPRNMLHNWSLYNSDSRFVSLELLPMKPCGEIDFAIFGSGIMTEDTGSGFCYDDDSVKSSSTSAELENVDGIPVYLSEIKEWVIEFGASMIFISIRTDLAWYRLGKPSKQYAPWYETVLRTARLSISIITLLKKQSRAARFSVKEVIKRLSEFEKCHPAFISSNPTAVERYVVVHGQIILQQFAEYPDNNIRRCPFVSGLQTKMEERHHTKCVVKKKAVTKKEINLNPRAAMVPVMRKQLLPATTTRLINRIWGEFYSNYSPEDLSKNTVVSESTEESLEEQDEDAEEDLEEQDNDVPVMETVESHQSVKRVKLQCSEQYIKWVDEAIQNTSVNVALHKKADVLGDLVVVGGCVVVETINSETLLPIYFVEYMYEKSDGRKMAHGRLMLRGIQTVLGNVANEREVFLTNNCLDFDLKDVKESVVVEIRSSPWGYQHRKANADSDKMDCARAEERKSKGLPMEYFVRSFYSPENGAFFALPTDVMGVGNGTCHACNTKKTEKENNLLKINSSNTGFMYMGTMYHLMDFFYVSPRQFAEDEKESNTFEGGRNVGLKPYIICQLLGIEKPKGSRQVNPQSVTIKARRFYRPDDISEEKAYRSHICEVYFSEQVHVLTLAAIQGKCEVKKKNDLSSANSFIYEHIFFCEHLYDPDSGALKQLPASLKLSSSNEKLFDDSASRKNKGKVKEGEAEGTVKEESVKNKLATLDIFAGCGGLSEGLQQSGVSLTKWAIEYEEPAGQAFNLNHPEATVFINNCNVILRAIMSTGGDIDDCITDPETSELAEKLDDDIIRKLPRPGQVEFINGGPPCQGFSGMNRFNKGAWSKVQCEMILAFLSFVDYFRPKYFLLENVRNFISFNKGQTFRLTIASLLEMGYQVRFGILEAGAFGVSQSRKRAFIWAASPLETLPEWPEPLHVFAGSELKVTLDSSHQYAAVRSTASGAPFRSITVRDTIGDLPDVRNGAYITPMEYKNDSVSWYQKMIRGDTISLTDHITKEMNELNLIRCQRIPKRPGADWRDLPEEKVRLSTGQMVDLVPWCLPNTADRHNQWKGLFGRLNWEGNFPTSITDPQPMGKVGMCFHPDQDRIVTVRECARSQGFSDGYKLAGNIQHRYRQIGNAVPPPLAFALGRKLKEVIGRP